MPDQTRENALRLAAAHSQSALPRLRPRDNAKFAHNPWQPRGSMPSNGMALPPQHRGHRHQSAAPHRAGRDQSREWQDRVGSQAHSLARRDDLINASPFKIADQSLQLARHRAKIGIVPHFGAQRRIGHARLIGINFPRVEVDDRGFARRIHLLHSPAGKGIREQAEEPTAPYGLPLDEFAT